MNFSTEQKNKLKKLENDIKNKKRFSRYEINNILDDLFENKKVLGETFIPISFLESEVGNIILKQYLDFNLEDENTKKIREYTVTETAKKLGKTRQYVYYLLKRGLLKGNDKHGLMLISAFEINKYKNKIKKE